MQTTLEIVKGDITKLAADGNRSERNFDLLQQNDSLEKVIFVCFGSRKHQTYLDAFERHRIELI